MIKNIILENDVNFPIEDVSSLVSNTLRDLIKDDDRVLYRNIRGEKLFIDNLYERPIFDWDELELVENKSIKEVIESFVILLPDLNNIEDHIYEEEILKESIFPIQSKEIQLGQLKSLKLEKRERRWLWSFCN